MVRSLRVNRPVGKPGRKKKLLLFLLFLTAVFVVVGLLGYFSVVSAAREALASAQKLPAHMKPLKDAILLQDLPRAKVELEAMDQDLSEIEGKLAPLSWMRAVPFARDYFSDAEHLLNAAHYGVGAAKKAIGVIAPVAGALGLKTETREAVQMSTEDQIAGLIEAMPQIAQGLESIEPDLLKVKSELASVDPNRYPDALSFEGQSVRHLLTQVRSTADQIDKVLPKIKQSLVVLPEALGQARPKRYAIIFQNDKEIRATGGFWTAYALATVEKGKITSLTSEDMYFVDYRIAAKTPAPAVYRRFLKIDHWFIRDANLSPDFKVAASKFLEFWRQAGMPPVDGVLALDTFFVRDFLKLLGPIEVRGYGSPLTYENVVVELEKQATLVKKEQAGRKALIGRLMDKMLEKALALPKQNWDDLISLLFKLAAEKHLILYFADEGAQSWAEELNWAGRVKDFEGDYLEVNEANFAGAKANLYVSRAVSQLVSKTADGKWVKEVTIDFENPEPYDGWLNGPYRCYVRRLVPKGSELVSIEGGKEAVPQESSFDEILGKQVFAAFTVTKPQSTSQLVFKYKLPDSVVVDGKYRLLVQKQPGHDAPNYEVTVNGETEGFELRRDREIEIAL